MKTMLKQLEIYNPDNSLRIVGRATSEGFASEIQMLVWNVYKARHQNWMSDFEDLMPGQDLVILQEAVLNSRYDYYFAENRRHEWILGRSFKHRHTGIETGVKTGSITPSIDSKSIFSPHCEPISRTPKIVLSTRYRLFDSVQQLLVLNVHAINFVSLRKYTNQLTQLSQEIAAHKGPVILAGDFNTWSARRAGLFRELTHQLKLLEAVMHQPQRLNRFPRQLDHVYYKGLKLQSIRLLSSISSSDHLPISVLFSR